MARRLRKFVIPSLLGSIGLGSIIGSTLYLKEVNNTNIIGPKVTAVSKMKESIPVLNEIDENKPLKPFVEETVGKNKDYYNSKDDATVQNNSLINYENTYMPNTGILYSSDESFDVIAVQSGTVTKISNDNILGKYIEIEHENGYKSVYYSLSETNVTEGTTVSKGDVIATSGVNKLSNIMNSNVLIETYHDGHLIDPEEFYNVDFNNIN